MSTIENAKKGCGWKHPNERASCRNCFHKQQESVAPGFCSPTTRCGKHGFYTKLYAICDDWKDIVGVRA